MHPEKRKAFLGADSPEEFQVGFLVLDAIFPVAQIPEDPEFVATDGGEELGQDILGSDILKNPGPPGESKEV